MNEITIKIVDIIDGDICVDPQDGQELYSAIASKIEDGCKVNLSFEGVTRITTAFLNAAVGQLYNEFSEENIRKSIRPVHAENWQLKQLKNVVDGAKHYFKKSEQYRESVDRVMGNIDGE